jgi:L-alanine-DL-glutamate epimerase-like enolase superfamily enzyme
LYLLITTPQLYKVPLSEVLADAKHGDHSHFELVVVEVEQEDGVKGVGYTYTGGKGGRAIWSLVEDELKSTLIGKDSGCIEKLWVIIKTFIHLILLKLATLYVFFYVNSACSNLFLC